MITVSDSLKFYEVFERRRKDIFDILTSVKKPGNVTETNNPSDADERIKEVRIKIQTLPPFHVAAWKVKRDLLRVCGRLQKDIQRSKGKGIYAARTELVNKLLTTVENGIKLNQTRWEFWIAAVVALGILLIIIWVNWIKVVSWLGF